MGRRRPVKWTTKPCPERGRDQAPLATKLSRDGSSCQVVTYVRNICRHRYRFHRDARTETMPPHIWYRHLCIQTRCPHRTYYLIDHLCREHRHVRTFQRDASAEVGLGSSKCTMEKRCRAAREYCIQRHFNVSGYCQSRLPIIRRVVGRRGQDCKEKVQQYKRAVLDAAREAT